MLFVIYTFEVWTIFSDQAPLRLFWYPHLQFEADHQGIDKHEGSTLCMYVCIVVVTLSNINENCEMYV